MTQDIADVGYRSVTGGLAVLIVQSRSRRSLSLNDVARRVRQAASREGVSACGVTRHTVYKWERGTVPRPDSLRWLAEALDLPVDVLVDAAPPRRPRSAVPAAGDDGGFDPVKRRAFLQTSAAVVGAAAADPLRWLGRLPVPFDERPELVALRDALLRPEVAGTAAGELEGAAAVAERVRLAWAAYQDARYSSAMAALPGLLADAQAVAQDAGAAAGDERRSLALRALADAYRLVAASLRKLGDRNLTTIAADRAVRAAERSGDPLAVGQGARTLSIALFETGHHREAIELATGVAATLGAEPGLAATPDGLSVHGLLVLAGAEAAADRGDRAAAMELFRDAERSARRLGRDANHRFTAFGPTNVAVHRIHAAVLLGDPEAAVTGARNVDLHRLPVPERRAHHLLDVAVSHGQMGRRDQALTTLLEAERLAAEEVRYDPAARSVVSQLLRRTRSGTAELEALAHRIGLPR